MNQKITQTIGLGSIIAASLAHHANAAIITWDGGAGNSDYLTAANWEGDVLPSTGETGNGDTARINGGNVVYTPAGDLQIRNGAKLQVSAGSFTQSADIAWMQFGGGSLVVDGGAFNQGGAGNIVLGSSGALSISAGSFTQNTDNSFQRASGSSIVVTGGIANFNGNIQYNPSASGDFSVTGGIVTLAGEFQPQVPFSLTAGSISATHLSFGGTGRFDLSGGTVSVNALSTFDGIFGSDADSSLNFTSGSTGQFLIRNMTLTELTTSKQYLTNGKVTIDGIVSSNPTLDFAASQSGNDVIVTLIPEPSAALLLGTFGVLSLLKRRRS